MLNDTTKSSMTLQRSANGRAAGPNDATSGSHCRRAAPNDRAEGPNDATSGSPVTRSLTTARRLLAPPALNNAGLGQVPENTLHGFGDLALRCIDG